MTRTRQQLNENSLPCILYGQGKYEEALVILNDHIQLNPYDAYAIYIRGLTHSRMKNKKSAKLDFDLLKNTYAISGMPEYLFCHHYAQGLALTGEYQESIDVHDQAIALNPGYINSYSRKAMAAFF